MSSLPLYKRYYVGFVGHEKAKFTPTQEWDAREIIRQNITHHQHEGKEVVVVSGGCHLGGVDIWAEEVAAEENCETVIFRPEVLSWEHGYKPRNISIAKHSDEVHNIVVPSLPADYSGMRFEGCYHCARRGVRQIADQPNIHLAKGWIIAHVKSGGCWTAWKAVEKFNKTAQWHVVRV